MSATSQLILALMESGMTQVEISALTGIPQPRLSKWSKGAPIPVDDGLRLKALVDSLEAAGKIVRPLRSEAA